MATSTSKSRKTSTSKPAQAKRPSIMLPRTGMDGDLASFPLRLTKSSKIVAVRAARGSNLIHAVVVGEPRSACGLKVESYKGENVIVAKGKAAALAVTCPFCQARLIAVGLLAVDAPNVTAYARRYGKAA